MTSDINGPVLRLIDANANRAREAMRVQEDYARFVLSSDELCGDLKSIRHALAQTLSRILPEGILHRDTPGDVGTSIKVDSEIVRADVVAVVIAAGKRLGEALRAIEEFLKIADPTAAGKIEALRYRFYDIERRVALTLRPAGRLASVRLYVLITESFCKIPWLTAAEQAIEGGADALQLREKSLEGAEFLRRAKQFAQLCKKHGCTSIINDRPDIAALSDADGVHLGQGDLSAAEARRIVGVTKIIGVSTHNISQARQAVLDGADYIGVGPIFKSATKPRDFLPGLQYAADAAKEISIPAIAIAGIGPENVDEVTARGIRAVAVGSAILGHEDIRSAAAKLKAKLPP